MIKTSTKFKTYKITIEPYSDENSEKLCNLLNKEWNAAISGSTRIFREGKTHIKHTGALRWDNCKKDIARISEEFPGSKIDVIAEIHEPGLLCEYLCNPN